MSVVGSEVFTHRTSLGDQIFLYDHFFFLSSFTPIASVVTPFPSNRHHRCKGIIIVLDNIFIRKNRTIHLTLPLNIDPS